ncbi:MAG: TonB-dependent receptor [Chitinophagaceae bacterium]|jgi:TonB-linked SusC/RagA family outer membrane protein|nr:TonB-dependent receptor [Chitinophagaceae bacterium]MCF8288604.1 TonB-dependent receptor [Chitinophagaceae bacterium]MCF8421390.1 TonB-dependent receptor [Chitinophagaceae bacterium]
MKKLLLVFALFLGFQVSQAQQSKVQGTVSDAQGKPIAGVSITLKGQKAGVVSENNGTYSISLSNSNGTLVFSSIGYSDKEVSINGKTTIDVVLSAKDDNLNEVVVVGYGTQKKKDITGSVGTVNASQIKNLSLTSPEQALQGRVAGVNVTSSSGTPGGAININVRGVGTINGSAQPLYVVDGIPIATGSFSQIGVGNQTLNSLADINPNDIESLDVLKDASATAIYGSRGANGVVLITTKRGKNQKTRFSYNGYYGTQEAWKKITPLTGSEFQTLLQESLANRYGGNLEPSAYFGATIHDNSTVNTNWQDLIFRTAPIQSHDISAQGGNDKTKFYVGGSYFDQDGTILGSKFQRYNFRINVDNQVSEKFKISTGLTGSNTIQNRIQNDNNIYGVLSTAVLLASDVPAYNADGTYGKDPLSSVESPLLAAIENYNKVNNSRVNANLGAEYQFIPQLSLKVNLGADYVALNEARFYPSISNAGAGVKGQATEAYNKSMNLVNENILSYKQSFGDHDLNAIAVASYQTQKFESLYALAENFPGNSIKRLSAGSVKKDASSSGSAFGIIGYVGRVNYGYKGKYLLSGSVRRDGTSNLGAEKRWGTFPAVSAAWRFSDEGFMRNLKFLNNGKIRGSHGVSGSNSGSNFGSLPLISPGANYLTSAGLAPSQLGNPSLGWETSTQTDIALELGFWNRITLTTEVYNRKTDNLLTSRGLVGNSGFTSVSDNVGGITNKGIEISLETRNFVKPNFSWTTNFNITFQTNNVDTIFGGNPFGSGFASWIQQGQSLSSFRGYRVDGIFQNASEIVAARDGTAARAGDIRWKDLNNDGKINSDDQEILGNALPKFFGSLTNNFNYKNFELTVFFQFVGGNKIYNNNRAFAEGMNSLFGQYATTLNRWTPTNPSTTMPRAVYGDPANNRRTSDRWLEDGSFTRLKNLVFAYNLDSKLASKMKVSSLKVYVQAQNLITWTNYSGFDPEVSTFTTTNTAQGTDFLTFPQAKTITFGLNVGF